MIMGAFQRRTIGQRYLGLSDSDRVMHHEQPYVVLREATADEWLAQHTAEIAPRKPDPDVVAAALSAAFFYDVSID